MIHGVAEAKCSLCPNMVKVRGREEIARGLRNTIAACLIAPGGLISLTAHLWWLEGELLGLCCNCIAARAAQFNTEARAEIPPRPQDTPRPMSAKPSPFLTPRLRVVSPEGT